MKQTTKQTITGIAYALGTLLYIPIAILFSMALWGVFGWLIGLIIGDNVLGWLEAFGIKNITMFQLFALLGMIRAVIVFKYFQSSCE